MVPSEVFCAPIVASVARRPRHLLRTNQSHPSHFLIGRRTCSHKTNRKTIQSTRPIRNTTRPHSETSFLEWYSDKLDSHPLITKCLTSGFIAGSGDVLCQWTVEGTSTWDKARTGRFGLLGCVLVAPLIHYWYGFLARTIPGTDVASIAKRVFLDQFVYTPPFIPLWLTSLWTLESLTGDNHSDTPFGQRIVDIFPDIYVANLTLWLPVMAFNFKFVAPKYQVLFSNVVALVWNTYLSFSTSREQKRQNE